MKIKTFKLNQEQEANDFIESVVMQENGVHVTSEGIVVFYDETKENYEDYFVSMMIENLKRNLYHEQVRQVSVNAEYEQAKEKGTSYPDFDELNKKQVEVEDNIKKFEAKINALEEWTKSNSSKE